MLFITFLLALTLSVQSVSYTTSKEDGEISFATTATPSVTIPDVHDLSTYPYIPDGLEERPQRNVGESAAKYKKRIIQWQSRRRAQAINKIYDRKRDLHTQVSHELHNCFSTINKEDITRCLDAYIAHRSGCTTAEYKARKSNWIRSGRRDANEIFLTDLSTLKFELNANALNFHPEELIVQNNFFRQFREEEGAFEFHFPQGILRLVDRDIQNFMNLINPSQWANIRRKMRTFRICFNTREEAEPLFESLRTLKDEVKTCLSNITEHFKESSEPISREDAFAAR